MPWEIKRNYGGCAGYAVVKEGTTEVEGCHSSREAAQRQMSALYASETDKAVVTNEVTPNKYPEPLKNKRKKVEKMMEPGTFAEGDFAMGTVDDHVYVGQIVHIMTDGMLGVEGSKKTIMASPENPAILIRIFEQHEDGYWKETYMFTGFDAVSGSKIDPLPMKGEYFRMGGIEKADSVSVGDMVSWNSSGGTARGKVVRVIRSGEYNVPNSEFSISGTEDDPAAAIRVYRDGKPTDTIVGHKVSTLRRIGKSMDELNEIKNIIKSWDEKEDVVEKSSIESDSAEQKEVPKDLSEIFTNMPTHAKRVHTTGNAPISLNLFRETNG